MPIRRLEKTYTGTTSTIGGDEIAASTIPVKPHIQPGVLQPAVAGKLLDGTTNHSGAYGTAQSDGHSYYYTDIKGSKPIKDPRIGGHFGSQRYLLSSAQLQLDETAMQGFNVYRFEGREWVRGSGSFGLVNDLNGIQYEMTINTTFIEITGYFSDANIQAFQYSSVRHFTWSVDGGSATTNTAFRTAMNIGPNGGRYVNGAGWQKIGLGATLGIHTLKILNKDSGTTAQDFRPYAFELIAQDTSSTANKSKIQIPSQNVISYGKKFTVSDTPHYDPFNGFTSGNATALAAKIDTGTSLGMANWLSGSTYYRPFNGGRVVKWVDSSGTIKTSVTMMPPNAQNISGTASNAIDLSSSQTNDDTINFNTGAIDHSLSEAAKTFFGREFGNGAANASTGAPWADCSQLANEVNDDVAYVMDDGLTAHVGEDVRQYNLSILPYAQDDYNMFTFIGTGITLKNQVFSGAKSPSHVAQNLPYGTHIIKSTRGSGADPTYLIDGVSTGAVDDDGYGNFSEVTFHQPKMPPIPEDACILADYMLMADFVAQSSAGIEKISKGVRSVSQSRDMFYDEDSGGAFDTVYIGTNSMTGLVVAYNTASGTGANTVTRKLPFFGTNFVSRGFQHDTRHTIRLDGVDKDSASTKNNDAVRGSYAYLTSSVDLGTYEGGTYNVADQAAYFESMDIVTPTHTSSHYQSFETPYFKELIGGDRNMEQTNLIVTHDGKSWDEVTRDTSYISKNICVQTSMNAGNFTSDGHIAPIATQWRGREVSNSSKHDAFQKNWAIGFDKMICLVDGIYNIEYMWYHHSSHHTLYFNMNGTHTAGHYVRSATGDETVNGDICDYFKRGDWFALNSQNAGTVDGAGRNLITITKIE